MEGNKSQFLIGLFGGIALVAVVGLIIVLVMLIHQGGGNQPVDTGNQDQAQNNQPTQPVNNGPAVEVVDVKGVKTFSQKKDAQVYKEDGKPVVYLFSTTWCPHCQWIHDTFDKTVMKYVKEGKIVAYHWQVDTGDNTLTDEIENKVPSDQLAVYKQFNPNGSIPTFVFGKKYFRIGNGYERQDDLDSEKAEFVALIEAMLK